MIHIETVETNEIFNDILNREDSDIIVQSIKSSIALTSNTNTSSFNILNETTSNINTFSNILNKTISKKLRKKGTSWTSNYKLYIGIIIHWISADFKLYQVLLLLEENLYSHTAINIFQKLKSIFEQFNLENKFIASVTDNVPNMIAAMKNFKNIKHIRYVAYTIQISVRKRIEEINSLVIRISNLNKFLVNPNKYHEKLRTIQQNNSIELTILDSYDNIVNNDN
ncbi:27_t:CDS:2, partial [Scutellospora calospora]